MYRVRVIPYSIPFVRPVRLGGQAFTARSGWILHLTDAKGNQGWGEACPLPGFSRESLEQAARGVEEAAARLRKGDVHPAATDCSSVRFAVELATASLEARQKRISLARAFAPAARPFQSINAVLLSDEPVLEARSAVKAGFRALKMKVGATSAPRDAARVRAVWEAIRGQATLRLDANRAWSETEALAFAGMIDGVEIEYVEEPVRDPERLPSMAARGLPIALDESLAEMRPEALADMTWLKAVVIKPTIVGGIRQAMRFAAAAGRLGIRPVISSAVETGVGLRGLAALAASIGSVDVPAGLDTGRFLQHDLTDPRFGGTPVLETDPEPEWGVLEP